MAIDQRAIELVQAGADYAGRPMHHQTDDERVAAIDREVIASRRKPAKGSDKAKQVMARVRSHRKHHEKTDAQGSGREPVHSAKWKALLPDEETL